MNLLENQVLLFEIDEENEDFTEIEEIIVPINELLDPSSILVVVDPLDKVIWIWEGKNAGIRKKFIATQKAPAIRDRYGIDFKIVAVDEGDEPYKFMDIIGL
jgi:hypothetical protein